MVQESGGRGYSYYPGPAAREKYRALSAKYGNHFYNYIGFVLTSRGPESWQKIIEGLPLETVDAAVSTWLTATRPDGWKRGKRLV
jgi:hypothetical protein